MAILLEQKNASRSCKTKEVNDQQVWKALSTKNNYLYTTTHEIDVSIICHAEDTKCTITGSGMLTIPTNCIIKSGPIEISAQNVIIGDISPIMFIPPGNIIDHIPSKPTFTNDIENWREFEQTNPELEFLSKAIQQQPQDADAQLLDVHDIHHYTLSHTIVAILIMISVLYMMRRRLQRMYRKRTSTVETNIVDPTSKIPTDNLQSAAAAILPIYSEPVSVENFNRPSFLVKLEQAQKENIKTERK